MTRQLRKSHKGSRKNGLVLANGGVLTYQHVTVLSSHPRDDGRSYPNEAVLPGLLELEAPEVEDKADGEAVIEVRDFQLSIIRCELMEMTDLYCGL